jgi:Cu-Zn family superoxide dismutase
MKIRTASRFSAAVAATLLALGLASCQAAKQQQAQADKGKSGSSTTAQAATKQGDMGPAMTVTRAVAVLHPTEGNTAAGTVWFTKVGDEVRVRAHVTGLDPGQKHGFHVHEYGDCSAADATSAGGHYDPEHVGYHGRPTDSRKHAGDLGNLVADDEGTADYDMTVAGLAPGGDLALLLGRGVIVHAKEDTFVQPTGGAGARIACGVIGIAKPAPATATGESSSSR